MPVLAALSFMHTPFMSLCALVTGAGSHAMLKGGARLVQYLLSQGADPNISDMDGKLYLKRVPPPPPSHRFNNTCLLVLALL